MVRFHVEQNIQGNPFGVEIRNPSSDFSFVLSLPVTSCYLDFPTGAEHPLQNISTMMPSFY